MDHYSIESCRNKWVGDLTATYQSAGHSMSRALRNVGLSVNPNPNGAKKVFIRLDGVPYSYSRDSYWVMVPPLRVPEVVAELRKDKRINKIEVDGVEVPNVKTAEEVQAEFDAFKKQVVGVAMKAAKKHDWCDVVKDALTEMGLEPPTKKLRVVLDLEADEDNPHKEDVKDTIYNLNRDDLLDAIKSFELVEE